MTNRLARDGVDFDRVQFDPLVDLDAAGWDTLEHLGRALHVKEAGLAATLDAVLAGAVRTVAGTRAAGLNLWIRGRFVPQAALGEAPHQLDAFQQRTGEGPCIDASRDQTVVHIADMRDERRWPDFADAARATRVLSMVCVPLWIDDLQLGSLSLYSDRTHVYGDHDLRVASLFATHAAIAIADAQRTENLRRALVNRDVIGQAKGILMERHRITSDQAFALLSKASQRHNRKLAEVAEEFTATGSLP